MTDCAVIGVACACPHHRSGYGPSKPEPSQRAEGSHLFTEPEEPVYSPMVKLATVDDLGPRGVLYSVSIDHYLWKAHYDLANALIEGQPDPDSHLGYQVQSMIDLEIQSSKLEQTGRWTNGFPQPATPRHPRRRSS